MSQMGAGMCSWESGNHGFKIAVHINRLSRGCKIRNEKRIVKSRHRYKYDEWHIKQYTILYYGGIE